jgi:uncharacterized membrane protein
VGKMLFAASMTIRFTPARESVQERIMSTQKATRAAMAAAAALLFTTVATTANAADEAKVKCEGVNSCKGTSACSTATNACQGQNKCKGEGYLLLPKAECDAAKAKMKK